MHAVHVRIRGMCGNVAEYSSALVKEWIRPRFLPAMSECIEMSRWVCKDVIAHVSFAEMSRTTALSFSDLSVDNRQEAADWNVLLQWY